MKFFLHLLLSGALLFVGEYSVLLLLQAAFLSTFFNNKKIFYLLYMPIIFFALVKIFASSLYSLYFINLFFLFFFLEKNELLLSWWELLVWSLYMLLLYATYIVFEEQIYDVYIMQNLQDKVNHLFWDVVLVLTLLHVLIFVILGYNKKNYLGSSVCI